MQWLSLAHELFLGLLCVFGVRWSTRFQRLQLLKLGVWGCWYPVIWTQAVQRSPILDKCDLDCMLTYFLFVLLTLGHVIVMLDTFLQRHMHQPDHQHAIMISIGGVLLPCLAAQLLISYCSLHLHDEGHMALFWIAAPSTFGLQLKLYAFLFEILLANVQVINVRQSLVQLTQKQTMLSRDQPQDIEAVVRLKQNYGQLNRTFQELNLSYGNSLATIFIVLFLTFVFNMYWLVKNLLVRQNPLYMMFTHLGVIIHLSILFSAVCWQCQQSFNHSRQIGCLISKLVKPLGSKRYNEMVSEFLLQTLHQRFVLTAKDFFSLNLHLLSSMCASVVTYLVILIQFMFAEKTARISPNKDAMDPLWYLQVNQTL